MNFIFDDKFNNFLKIVASCATNQNVNLYFVGGMVRDKILNIPIKDVDLIVDTDAIKFAQLFPGDIKIKSIHKDFSTIKVEYDNLIIDIASTRTESYPYSGCLPVVNKVGVKIEEDYLRRDFSVNSLYAKIIFENNELKYELIDFADGVNDINNKTLKVLHNNSYIDDPTRILRGVDFKYRFGFDFSNNDKKLISEYFKNLNLEQASKDRINAVLKKIINKDNFSEIIQNGYYRLVNDTDLSINFDLIDKINLNKDSDFYYKLILNLPLERKILSEPVEIIKEFSKYTDSEVAYYFYKTQDENIEKYWKIKDIKLSIRGDDLLGLGYSQGNLIGVIMNSLYNAKIAQPENFITKKDELDWVLKKYALPLK